MGQCHYLIQAVIPALRKYDRNDPEILGADLNLGDGRSPNAQTCLVPGYLRADEGAPQDIVVGGPLTVISTRSISMHGTTDHPDLLADLATN
jgi:hypothetical protein